MKISTHLLRRLADVQEFEKANDKTIDVNASLSGHSIHRDKTKCANNKEKQSEYSDFI